MSPIMLLIPLNFEKLNMNSFVNGNIAKKNKLKKKAIIMLNVKLLTTSLSFFPNGIESSYRRQIIVPIIPVIDAKSCRMP